MSIRRRTASANQGIAYPDLDLHLGSSAEDLVGRFGTFPLVLSLEVVEHVYDPHRFATCLLDLLEPGGTLVLSTPCHGYLKNLALALSRRMEAHFTALWPHGHIKFWSEETMRKLLSQAGFTDIRYYRAGRFAPLAKSLVAVARRPL